MNNLKLEIDVYYATKVENYLKITKYLQMYILY